MVDSLIYNVRSNFFLSLLIFSLYLITINKGTFRYRNFSVFSKVTMPTIYTTDASLVK